MAFFDFPSLEFGDSSVDVESPSFPYNFIFFLLFVFFLNRVWNFLWTEYGVKLSMVLFILIPSMKFVSFVFRVWNLCTEYGLSISEY